MQAVILAGGLGTRLRPLTYDIPKPMVLINNKPYLEYQLNYLKQQGITNIVLLVGYLGEQIQTYFGNGDKWGLQIQYSFEKKPMGTGGGLKNAQTLLEDVFLLIYGDSFLPLDYNDLAKTYCEIDADMVLCVYENSFDTDVISNIALDESNGCVLQYVKNKRNEALKYVDAGVMMLKKSVLDYIPLQEVVSLEQQIFPMLIEKQAMNSYVTKARFYDIGTPERLALAMEVLG